MLCLTERLNTWLVVTMNRTWLNLFMMHIDVLVSHGQSSLTSPCSKSKYAVVIRAKLMDCQYVNPHELESWYNLSRSENLFFMPYNFYSPFSFRTQEHRDVQNNNRSEWLVQSTYVLHIEREWHWLRINDRWVIMGHRSSPPGPQTRCLPSGSVLLTSLRKSRNAGTKRRWRREHATTVSAVSGDTYGTTWTDYI